jgi:hypothetical protein
MRRDLSPRLIRLAIATLVCCGAWSSLGAPASAGGWAVGSLDAMPAAEPGQTAQVGFTILQHGVTPVDLDEGVGIEIVRDDGTAAFFPATSDGSAGHYLSAVTFPETSGSYAWKIRMGWFGPHELGTLDVRSPATGTGGSIWPDVRWVMVPITIVLAAIAVASAVADRRRRLAMS